MPRLFGLVDCNNFYASCERVFEPALNGRPIVVLSNNDGCVIARSNEAKALGIQMGDAEFKIRTVRQGFADRHRLRAEKRSRCFTTRWEELLRV